MAGPLHGLAVVEMEGLGPCPLAGRLLADLGAFVTVITRDVRDDDPADIENQGKMRLALDLKSGEGFAAAAALISRADVLIEGFRPGVMERLGLGPEIVHQVNPGLIYGRVTGWGQEGPLAQSAGHDLSYLAITGILNAIGKDGEPPPPPLNMIADYAGGTMFLLLGVLSALHERNRSGLGQVIDAAMVDGASALTPLFRAALARGEFSAERSANLLDGGAPFYRCYETKGGGFIAVSALEPKFHAEFLRLAGLPADHAASQMDRAKWPERHALYEAHFRRKTRDEWARVFDGSEACAAPVLNWDEAPEHPHIKARKTLERRNGVMQASPAPRFSRSVPEIEP